MRRAGSRGISKKRGVVVVLQEENKSMFGAAVRRVS